MYLLGNLRNKLYLLQKYIGELLKKKRIINVWAFCLHAEVEDKYREIYPAFSGIF